MSEQEIRKEAIAKYTNLLRIKAELKDVECKELEKQIAEARAVLAAFSIDTAELERVYLG